MVDSIQDNTEIPADPQEEQVPKTSTRVVAARSKAKAKPQPRILVGTTMKEDGLTLSHQNKILLRMISRRNLSIFIDTIKQFSEKKMEQLNYTKSNSIFEIIIHKYRIGLMIVGKLVWLQEEDRNEDVSIALIIREQFSTSEFFKDILETILLILRYRTMWNWNIPLHLPRRTRFQSSFNYQQWIDTWRSKFEQKTNSVLLAC